MAPFGKRRNESCDNKLKEDIEKSSRDIYCVGLARKCNLDAAVICIKQGYMEKVGCISLLEEYSKSFTDQCLMYRLQRK